MGVLLLVFPKVRPPYAISSILQDLHKFNVIKLRRSSGIDNMNATAPALLFFIPDILDHLF